MITLERLETLLSAFPRLSIGLAGDLFLDRYLDIDPDLHESSVETGLEAFQISRIRNSPGAMGTVINNLAALGVRRLVPVTVIGDDGQAYDLLKELRLLKKLRQASVHTGFIIRDRLRNTPTYTKPMKRDADGVSRELNRLDLRNREPLSARVERRLLAHLSEVLQTDGLIVLDQVNEEGWGVVGPRVRERLAELAARDPSKLIFVDSRARIGLFRCGVLKADHAECLAAVEGVGKGDKAAEIAAIQSEQAAEQLSALTGRPVYCTLGERGIQVVRPGKPTVEVPAYPVRGPIDVVGAGDSATSGIVASLLAGATEVEAAAVGNLVASITVEQIGTTGTATPQQVIERWREFERRSAESQTMS